ncbi:MAG: serine hydrolase [Planctomycetes bacterium]|nr:serine hydrolase [Planctomycetota bacterium]
MPRSTLAALVAALVVAFILAAPSLAQDRLADVEIADSALPQYAAERRGAGYRPIALSTRDAAPAGVHAVVWERDASGIDWAIIHGEDETAFLATSGARAAAGYRLVCLDTVGDAPNERHASVWRRDAATSPVVTLVRRIAPANLAATVTAQRALGRELLRLGGSGTTGSETLCALFAAGAAATSTSELAATAFASWLSNASSGARMVPSLTAYGSPGAVRFAALSLASPSPVDASAGVSNAELPPLTRWMLARDHLPLAVESWDDGSTIRHTVTWHRTSAPFQFLATGSSTPELAPLDVAMQNYMTVGNVAHAVLAVTKDGRLVHARGYNRTRTGATTAQPDSDARIGSMSKTLTAVAVLQLVERNLIGLDQRVATILDLSNYVDPGAQTMTVRQLLRHTSGIGTTALIGNEVAIANALQRPLPTDPWMWVEYMATRPFASAPYQRYEYSNFGYCLLGRIVETVAGVDYASYVTAQVLGPICAGRMRIGQSALGGQGAHELPYVFPTRSYGTSVLGDGATVPYVYGGFNVATADSLGGWVTSAEAYARFLCAFEDPSASPLLSASSIAEMWAVDPVIWGAQARYYGMGWVVDSASGSRFHGGEIAGTHAAMQKRADGVNFVAILGMSNPGAGDLRTTIDGAISTITNWPAIDLWSTTPGLCIEGRGCGELGASLVPGTLPVIGERTGTRFAPLATGVTAVAAIIGFSASPLDLTSIGLPGCTLFPSPDVLEAVPLAAGQADWFVTLPNSSVYLGASLHVQGVSLAPSSTPPIALSHAAVLRIGG